MFIVLSGYDEIKLEDYVMPFEHCMVILTVRERRSASFFDEACADSFHILYGSRPVLRNAQIVIEFFL